MSILAAMACLISFGHCKPPPPPPTPSPAPETPPSAVAPVGDAAKTEKAWREADQQAFARAKPAPNGETQARNVILFVGDGMGLSTVTAARILDGQIKQNAANNGVPPDSPSGEENILSFEAFPSTALVKTYTVDMQVPESAGAMTAIMTGVKTRGATLGMDATPERGQCAGAEAHKVVTLLEQAKDKGLAAGLVTTSRVTLAVPAAAYAHVSDRDWEFDARMPLSKIAEGCQDVASQLVAFSHPSAPTSTTLNRPEAKGRLPAVPLLGQPPAALDVVLGGGRLTFLTPDETDPRPDGGAGVRRPRGAGTDLIYQWQSRNPTGSYATNAAELRQTLAMAGPVLGLFAPDNMAHEADRAADPDLRGEEPSLTDMTDAAITLLSRNQKGYVLVVAAGGIDRAHHLGQASLALTDTIELSRAVAKAAQRTSPNDTLIIVTATQGHSLTIAGYPTRGADILGLARDEHGPQIDLDNRPYTTLTYANGPGLPQAPGSASPSDQSRAYTYVPQAAVRLAYATHSGEDVPVYARGPGSQWVRGTIEQSVLYTIMSQALWPPAAAKPAAKPSKPPAPAKAG